MVAKVQVNSGNIFTFPKGESVVNLKVVDGTVIKMGSIPDHVTELNMGGSKPVFEEGAIPSTLRYLQVQDLTDGSYYPPGLNLFIRCYTGTQPLPEGVQNYVHTYCRGKVKDNSEHHLFYFIAKVPEDHMTEPTYDYGKRLMTKAFGVVMGTVKRAPKIKIPLIVMAKLEPMIPPTSLAYEQTKLLQAKYELVVERKKLAQLQLELIEEQSKAVSRV